MFVSLILATCGRVDEIGRLMESLAAQSDPDFEVLVVDQNQDDRLKGHIASALNSGLVVRHLRMSHPNLSEARNFGIAEAKGEIIGFPDDDCWYESDTIAELRRAFSLMPMSGGVVGRWVEQSQAVERRDEAVLTAREWREFRGGDASSITLFFRREVFDAAGLFDVRLGIGRWYGSSEETDMVMRILSKGIHMVRFDAARVHHAFTRLGRAQSFEAAASTRLRARGTGALYAKHKLSWRVIFRGFLAPLLRPMMFPFSSHGLRIGLALARGRVEGYLSWLRNEC